MKEWPDMVTFGMDSTPAAHPHEDGCRGDKDTPQIGDLVSYRDGTIIGEVIAVHGRSDEVVVGTALRGPAGALGASSRSTVVFSASSLHWDSATKMLIADIEVDEEDLTATCDAGSDVDSDATVTDYVTQMLNERGNRYGSFVTHAEITQALKRVMQRTPNWDRLPPHMKETLEMIAHKIGRILNGDPMYDDSWRDIIGYTQLVIDLLPTGDHHE